MSHQKLFNNYFSTYNSHTQTGGAPAPALSFNLINWAKQRAADINWQPTRAPNQINPILDLAEQQKLKAQNANNAANAARFAAAQRQPKLAWRRGALLNETGKPQRTLESMAAAQRQSKLAASTSKPQRTLE